MNHDGPYIVEARERDRSARAGLQAGDCLNVCAACGVRMVVPPAAGHPPILQHREDCERSWGFTPDEAIRYEDGSQALVDNWPHGITHTRVTYRKGFATREQAVMHAWSRAADQAPQSEYRTAWPTFREFEAALRDCGAISLPGEQQIVLELTTWHVVIAANDGLCGHPITEWDEASLDEALAAWNARYAIEARSAAASPDLKGCSPCPNLTPLPSSPTTSR